MTPLDVADWVGPTGVIRLLKEHGGRRAKTAARPSARPGLKVIETAAEDAFVIDEAHSRIALRQGLDDEDWEQIFTIIAEKKIAAVDANGQLSDALMERLATFDHITSLNASNSKALSDAGLKLMARLPRLQHLDISNAGITDRGLEVLRELSELARFELCWDNHLSDAGLANLTFCDKLEDVNVMGSHVGDGTINALTFKRQLQRLATGRLVTDAGLPLLHHFPRYKSWSGGEPDYSLMDFRDHHADVLLDGPFTNEGLRQLAGLDGLSGLGFFRHATAITPEGLASLVDLPNLRFLGCGGALCTDIAMRQIAALPKLRMLQGQGAVATDAGFEALSRSQTLEYLWGRDCPNLGSRGFRALAALPALKGLGISCKNVNDDALATLPEFPARRQLMPMDVGDKGFQHVGKCEQLERLWCMYCRDTTDAATAHIAGLRKLTYYYAGETKITDRSLEILGGMTSLEKLEFWNCAGITNAGVAHLAKLPQLREVVFDGCRRITADAATAFPSHVHIRIWA